MGICTGERKQPLLSTQQTAEDFCITGNDRFLTSGIQFGSERSGNRGATEDTRRALREVATTLGIALTSEYSHSST